MDVHDFMEGEVKVKVVGQKVVMVEGHTNSNTNTGDFSLTSQSFRRQFSLPDQTNIEVITAAMSSDGILTITVPKSVSIIETPKYYFHSNNDIFHCFLTEQLSNLDILSTGQPRTE